MKIGITEQGDASIYLTEWVSKIEHKIVNKAIVITKNLKSERFRSLLVNFKEEIILHATVTFLGGSLIEPNVPSYKDSFSYLEKLVESGFPSNRIVFRCDPILHISQIYLLEKYSSRLKELGIQRIRFSFCDFYPHVRKRFIEKEIQMFTGKNNFSLEENMKQDCIVLLNKLGQEFSVESCAEGVLGSNIQNCGCISNKDLEIFEMSYQPDNFSKQRSLCKCLSCKTELLNHKEQCPYKCLYCYWH